MTAMELALALLRTTLVTAAAACAAALLLSALRVRSPRTHRITWTLVVVQGWLLVPWTLEIDALPDEHALRPNSTVSSTLAWSTSDAPRSQAPTIQARPRHASRRLLPLAIVGWLAGAAILTVVAAIRYARIARTLPRGDAPDNPHWYAEWNEATQAVPTFARSGVRTSLWRRRPSLDFRITDCLGPLLAYLPFKYLVLVPRPLWIALTSAERTAILRHELAHIRRRDLWKSLALRVVALPQWFNPFVWLAMRRFDEAAEWACDDDAASGEQYALVLAKSLLRTAELCAAHAPLPRAAHAIAAVPSGTGRHSKSKLARRIGRLVTPRFKEESIMRKLAVPALLAAVAAIQLIRIERVSAETHPARTDAAAEKADSKQPASAKTRREYTPGAWPRYVIEPPDILSIEGVKLVPKAPHIIAAFDVLLVRAAGAEQPIDDSYSVDADGTLNLGPAYGRFRVVGLTIDEVEAQLQKELAKRAANVEVSASLVASAGAQQITGQHLVAMDGRVNLGVYGSVFVAGMTIDEARKAIETKLAADLDEPQVSVDVLAYNSKVYYVITKGGRLGDDVTRAPITGNETVLDAIASRGGLRTSKLTKIWIARPPSDGRGAEEVLQVSWNDIADGTSIATNYQLMPGDRLFIDEPRYSGGEPADSSETPADAGGGSPYHPSDGVQHYAPTPEAASEPARKKPAVEGEPEQAAAPREPSPVAPPTPPQASARQMLYDILIVEDAQNSMAEFEGLEGDGVTTADAAATQAAVRMLEKHHLVRRIAEPRLVTTLGRTARLSVGGELPATKGESPTPPEETRVEISAMGPVAALAVSVNATIERRGKSASVKTTATVPQGHVMIARMESRGEDNGGPVYLIVTPSTVN